MSFFGDTLNNSKFLGPLAILGCPGTEVRIKGDRISGLFHPKEYPIYKDR